MKKILFAMFSMALLLVGCQSENETFEPATPQDEINVEIKTTIPNTIGAKSAFAMPAGVNSAKGGVSNVNPVDHKLRYTLQIIASDGTSIFTGVENADIDGNTQVTFSTRLVRGASYKFVAWADFTDARTPKKDLHYKTANLSAIEMTDAATKLFNEDSKDAYFYSGDVTITALAVDLKLKRPLGKVRYITSDMDIVTASNKTIGQLTLKYETQTEMYTKFNATTGDVDLTSRVSAFGNNLVSGIVPDASNNTKEQTLYWDYFFAPTANAKVAFTLSCSYVEGGKKNITVASGTNVTAGTNKLTTLRQNGLTDDTNIKLDVVEGFDDFENLLNSGIYINDGTTHYATIADAMTAATDGDVINLPEGIFTENIVIKDKITVEGKGLSTVLTGHVTLAEGSILKDVKSYFSGTERVAVDILGSNTTLDGVIFDNEALNNTANRREAAHAGATVVNVTIQNCTFNIDGNTTGYWKGIYLNKADGLKVMNNTFKNCNPFGVDHYSATMIVTGNTFDRSSIIGNSQTIHIGDDSIGGDGSDTTLWPTGLLETVKEVKSANTWLGSQISGARAYPIKVKSKYVGGEANGSWVFF